VFFSVAPSSVRLICSGVSRKEYLQALLENKTGSSGQTCGAMISYLAIHRPPFLIFENVPELVEGADSCNLNWLSTALHKIAYEMGCRILSATNYFMPQNRRRVFGICMDMEVTGLSQSDCKDLVEGIWMGLWGGDGSKHTAFH
jgi:site-specific DNA-cytosine methylase